MSYRQPFPGDYQISQRFGEKITNPKGHTGIDYLCPLNTPVLASEDGQVFFAGWDKSGYGNCVILKHADGRSTLYAHLGSIHVTTLEKVRKGSLLGHSGNTGNSTGPHLHFEVRDAEGKPVDPMSLPLQNVIDTQEKPVKLKEADEYQRGDLVRIVCKNGAKAFFNPAFEGYTAYSKGTEFFYTGDKVVRSSNGLTYLRVVPATFSVYVAVHNKDTQILDK